MRDVDLAEELAQDALLAALERWPRDGMPDNPGYLGVCFGGQLLAEAVGGHVERAPVEEQEIGLVTFDQDAALPIPAGPWFTWHEDRVVVPDDVEVLAPPALRREVAAQLQAALARY